MGLYAGENHKTRRNPNIVTIDITVVIALSTINAIIYTCNLSLINVFIVTAPPEG